MKILIVILLVIVLFIVLTLLIGLALMEYVIRPKRYSLQESMEIEKSKNFWGNYDKYPKTVWNIEGFDGYLLHGILLSNQSNKYVILTHGYQYTRYGSVKYANLFYEMGYNVYLYDLRHHGENKSTYCSMGYLESQDIIAIKEAIKERFGDSVSIGLHGESLGAASSIQALGLTKEFTFCIADCGFASLSELLSYQAKWRLHMPGLIVHIASGYLRMIYHYSFYQVNPIQALSNNHTPVLFIHGENDDFIPSYNSKRMFEAADCQKGLLYFPHAKHAGSYQSDPQRYRQMLDEFLGRISTAE